MAVSSGETCLTDWGKTEPQKPLTLKICMAMSDEIRRMKLPLVVTAVDIQKKSYVVILRMGIV